MDPDSVHEQIPFVLSRHVRVMIFAQLRRAYPETSQESLRRSLNRLGARGLILSHQVLAHPEIPLSGPVVSWHPGLPAPSFEKVAYSLQVRWRESIRRQTVYTASPAAIRIYGGPSARARSRALKNTLQVTHDLHVSTVFLTVRERRSDWRTTWISEDLLPPVRRGKLPDAIIRTGSGDLFIEFGGAYRADRVKRVHCHCAQAGLPYELW